MISFIIAAALICIASLIILALPLIRTSKKEDHASDPIEGKDSQSLQNIQFTRQRLKEIEQQFQQQALSQQEYDELKAELTQGLAAQIEADQQSQVSESSIAVSNNGVMLTLLCTLVPFSAILLYLLLGTPSVFKVLDQAEEIQAQNHDVNQMLAKIEQRLAQQPDDLQGWLILARSYLALNRYEDALNANLNALQLQQQRSAPNTEIADTYARLADSAALSAGGKLTGQPSQYIQQALNLNPSHPQALWLAGLTQAQLGNSSEARRYWNILMPLLADSPQQQQELQEIISQSLSEPSVAALPETAQVQSLPKAKPQEAAEGVQQAGLTVSLSLADSIANKANPSDLVFVFAKAINGPPAPLAVKRLRVADLPTTVRLSDQDAMMPQFKLSLFEQVQVSARLSKSGQPIAQAGDIESDVVQVNNKQTEPIRLLLSKVKE